MNNEQLTNSNSQSTRHSSLLTSHSSLLTPHFSLLIILLVAAFLRLYQLPTLPPGLNFDEAGNGVAALDILNGAPKLWWPIGGGKEPLWPYVVALTTAIFGRVPLAIRLPAALLGTLTVAAVYPLAAALFRSSQGRLIGLLAVLGLALSGWHLHFSRLGFRAILLPLLSTLAFYFFWKGVVDPKTRKNILLAALFMALAIYSYLAARLLPLVPLLFFALPWLSHLFVKRQKNHSSRLTPHASRFILHLFALLLLFLAPLIIYFILNPADLVARSTTVSIFNPAWNNGDLPGTAWRTLTLTLGTFLGLHGDANPLVNLPGQPAIPIYLASFFTLGFLVSLYHTIKLIPPSPHLPISPSPHLPTVPSPHLFLLGWWIVMLLPAILAPEGAPHHLRLIGTLVPTYIFVALGLAIATNFLANKLLSHVTRNTQHAIRLASLLPATCYLLLSIQTYTNYFDRWPSSVDFTLPLDLYATRLAADIAGAPNSVAYVLPMDIRAGDEARHYTLDYLLAVGPSAYTYIPVDERNAKTLLTQAAAGKDEVRVVRWTADKHRQADAKEIVTYLLETTAQPVGQASFPVYDVETYALPDPLPPDAFTLPDIRRPVGVVFGGKLRVDSSYLPASISGNWLPVAVTLAPLAPMDTDYKASLRLLNRAGQRVAQKDRVLLHNFHQGTSLWPPESVNEYYLLPIPADAPPGSYTVTLVIYHPDTLEPLVAGGQVDVPLGATQVE